jgi:hypothetical protein
MPPQNPNAFPGLENPKPNHLVETATRATVASASNVSVKTPHVGPRKTRLPIADLHIPKPNCSIPITTSQLLTIGILSSSQLFLILKEPLH